MAKDYIERMDKELYKLIKKMDKIDNFERSENFAELPAIERDLLYAQYAAMHTYSHILDMRLKMAMSKAKKGPISVTKIGSLDDFIDMLGKSMEADEKRRKEKDDGDKK